MFRQIIQRAANKYQQKESARSHPTPDKDLQKIIRESFEETEGAEEQRGFINEEAVINIIKKNKSAAEARYKYPAGGGPFNEQDLPLHIAIKKKASFKVIDALYRAYPEAVEVKTDRGWTALHLACRGGASLDVISLLLERWPEAVEVQGGNGYTALHCACDGGASLDVISLLLERWPEAVEVKDNDGCTALHLACWGGASLDVISLLLECWPESVEMKDNFGSTALHWACQKGASLDVISLLLERWPQAVEVKDSYGRMPWARSRNQKIMISGIRSLLKSIEQSAAKQIMADFVEIEWWGGVWLFLDLCVDSVKILEDIPLSVIPILLSKVGCHCKLLTLWNMLKNKQDILKID